LIGLVLNAPVSEDHLEIVCLNRRKGTVVVAIVGLDPFPLRFFYCMNAAFGE